MARFTAFVSSYPRLWWTLQVLCHVLFTFPAVLYVAVGLEGRDNNLGYLTIMNIELVFLELFFPVFCLGYALLGAVRMSSKLVSSKRLAGSATPGGVPASILSEKDALNAEARDLR